MRLPRALLPLAALGVVAVYGLDTYDVVVVGSGPGGLLAAEYLSRDPSIKVLVLEAGGPSLAATGNTNVPDWLKSSGNPPLTAWDVPGEYTHDASIFSPQNSASLIDYVDDRRLFLAQMVGGSSSVNAALYFRVPDAYVSNTKWPFDAAHVSQRYDEIEREVFGWTDLPSTDGKRYLQEAYDIVARALKRGGYSEKAINDAQARNSKPKTFGHAPFAIKDGMRDSPAKTCWGKMKSRSNVKLLTGARVTYVKHTRGKATGVVYNDNIEVGVSDRGAVLMAAGALGTPKVLIQSGIGPSDQLNGLKNRGDARFRGIQASFGNNGDGWVVNNNVGKNLFDTTLALGSFTHNDMKAFKFESPARAQLQSDYLNGRKGPLTTSGPVLVAYDNYIVQGRLYEFQLTVHANGFNDAGSNDKAFGTLLLINNPESRDRCAFDVGSGKYRAFASDSLYMATGRDLAALQDFTGKMVGMIQQEGASFVKKNEQSLNDWVAGNRGAVSNHFGGTCYVSKDANDQNRCADDKLRVVGTSNIYISDASAMRDGTVNPYGFIMYIGREVGALVKDALANPTTPTPTPSTPQPPSGGCKAYTVEVGQDYTGNDVANAKSPTFDGCCALCAAQSGCGAFTWTNYNGGTCWLKSGKGKATTNSGSTSAFVVAPSKTVTSCPVLENNVDYSGADIGSQKAKGAGDCCGICQAKAGCGAFTWSNFNGGTCWLKSAKGSTVASNGVTSGVLQTSTCGAIEENVDYSGSDVGNVPATKAEDCCEQCNNKNGCNAYSWSLHNGGTCWLKSGKGSATSKSGVRSGQVTKPQPRTFHLHHHFKDVFRNETSRASVHKPSKKHSTKKDRETATVHVRVARRTKKHAKKAPKSVQTS